MADPNWRTMGMCVRGASHLRSGLPNQDAIKYFPESGLGVPIILSLADGHGSAHYFRSDIGSRLAVKASCEVCERSLLEYQDKESVKYIKFKDVICREIVRCWKEKVNSDIHKHPFTPDEEMLIQKKMGNPQKNISERASQRPPALDALEENQIMPYGSTVLTVVLTPGFILYLQLGDGDILTVSHDGTVSRPLPGDERLFANETTSLCLPVAWDEFRIRYQPLDEISPALIMVSTDGYANSFPDEKNFEKVATDILAMIGQNKDGIERGIDLVSENLEEWLNETSEKGCGDDITVGLILNLDNIRRYSQNIIKVSESKEEMPCTETVGFQDKNEQSTISKEPEGDCAQ